MNRKHKVIVSVADSTGRKQAVMTSRRMRFPKRFLQWLFGDFCDVLVISPGHSVHGIEISEFREEGGVNEQ